MSLNPRYKSSKQWTEFPNELTQEISSIFKQNFQKQLRNTTEVHVSGRVYTQEILLRVGLHKKGELRFQNFEVSLDHNNDQEQVVQLIYLAVDAIASLMVDYFENEEDIELPYSWMEYPFNGKKVWLQFSTENPDLQAAADKLLGIHDESLLKNAEDERSEDALDATEEEFDELVEKLEPTMFKPKKKKDEMH